MISNLADVEKPSIQWKFSCPFPSHFSGTRRAVAPIVANEMGLKMKLNSY